MEQHSPEAQATKPPYIPFRTFLNLLARMGEDSVPARVDRSYLSNQSGTTQTYLIAALRFFDLIDEDGRPQPALSELAKEDGRATRMAELLRQYYERQVELGAIGGTQKQLEESFQPTYNGETARKAAAFFLQAAKYAEVAVSPHFKVPREKTAGAPTGNGGSRARRTTRRRTALGGQERPITPGSGPTREEHAIELRSGGTLTLAATVRFFTLSREDREFVYKLIDALRDYEAGAAPDPTPGDA